MGEKRNACRILMGKPEEKMPLGGPRRKWGLILKWILGLGGMDGIDLAQERDRSRALVNTVMNIRDHKMGNYSVVARLAASQEGLGSMELVGCVLGKKRNENGG
jgi:hypothetical protein